MLWKLILLLLLNSCYLRHYPLHAGIAKVATFKIVVEDGTGTGWAVDKYHLITAGHVCNSLSLMRAEGPRRRFYVEPVVWEYNGADYDICLLKSSVALDSWLIISDMAPKTGDNVGFVGYPGGEYGESSGTYLGDMDTDDSHENDNVFTAPCAAGASGSAVYTERGVWGVLVRKRTDGGYIHPGEEGCVAVGWDKLTKFLRDAGINYDTPPEIPDAIP